ncbi:Glycosyltransferase [Hexamita inflata]|uniref:protein xylosyltransferase n=1 Tax=Hexamita inflata TaxID=28002 RepID=A0AA86PDE5_9EUKA|nr:Glycosyltransferase [Hexamita inflata]
MIILLATQQKQAFLIIAYHQPVLLQQLVSQIDNINCDIYIHYDNKSVLPEIVVLHSSLVFTNRIDVKWGKQSLIEAELILFEAAFQKGPYDFYHLLSGQDLLLQQISVVLDFFGNHTNTNFVGFGQYDGWYFWDYNKKRAKAQMDSILLKYGQMKYGSQWCSLTQSAVNILVTEKLDIQKYFYGLDSADEFYKQTVLLAHNQSFYDIKNQFNGNQRHIDWSNGGPNPKTFDKSDLSVLLSIPRMFARKFNIEHMDVINAIIAKTNQKEIEPQLQQNIQDVRDISA